MDEDYVVWRWLDTSSLPTKFHLAKFQLSTGIQEELLFEEYPEDIVYPTIYGETVFFNREAGGNDIYRIGLIETEETQLTESNNNFEPIGGEVYVVYSYSASSSDEGIRAYNMETDSEMTLMDSAAILSKAFDGTRWVAAYVVEGSQHLYKYDLEHPELGQQVLDDTDVGSWRIAFNEETHELVGSYANEGETQAGDLFLWNPETNEKSLLLSEPWDQGSPDYSGHLITYIDSQINDEGWFGSYMGELKVIDRETLVKRVILPNSQYYGVGVWSHYIAANNVGPWGDVIIACDLEVMGIVDADGHVIPEDTEMDAGVDAGN